MLDTIAENNVLLILFSLLVGVGVPIAVTLLFRYLNDPLVKLRNTRGRQAEEHPSD